jgi:hypothetical protein
MPEHKDVSANNIHEPKGAAAAAADTVYVADGAGSGSFTAINNLNLVQLHGHIVDISTAGSSWIVAPIAGNITKIYSVIHSAISGADCNLSFEIGGTAITNGGITITQSGSAAGDVDSSTPTAANTVTAGQAIELITDGASTGTSLAVVTFLMDVS